MLASQVATFVPGQRSKVTELKIEENPSFGKPFLGQAISNLVGVLVSDLWAMAGKNGTVFDNNWPPF